MASTHRYDLVTEDESKKGLITRSPEGNDYKDEVPNTRKGTAWWKLLLSHLLAVAAGAAAVIIVASNFYVPKPSHHSTIANTTSSANSTQDLPTPSGLGENIKADIDLNHTAPNMPVGTIMDCGYSPSEAREKGCIYDVMMQDWVPPPCYDEVLTQKYLKEGNWTWYGAGDGSVIISDEDMAKGEHGAAWMSTSYHKAHCVFSWLKIVRALRNDAGISQELLSYDHVLHCSHGALKADSSDEGLGVRAPTNYAKCALYDTWKLDFIPDKHNSTQKRSGIEWLDKL